MGGELQDDQCRAEGSFRFLDDARVKLWLVGGKGGVGKTTAAAALSLHLARKFPGRRCLTVSTGPSHSLSEILDLPLDATPRSVYRTPNLFALQLDACKLLSDFKARHGPALRSILSRGTYLDEEDISRFLELSFPGLDELMAMLELIDLLESGGYDTLIVDMASTGHLLRLLSLPALTGAWVAILDRMMEKHRYISRVFTGAHRRDQADEFIETLNRDLSRLAASLQDQRHCRFVAVTLLQPVVLAETERLLAALGERGIAVAALVINQVLPQTRGCALCASLEAQQADCFRRLVARSAPLELALFPALPEEPRGKAKLRALLESAPPRRPGLPPGPHRPYPGPGPPVTIPAPESGRQFFLFCGKGGVGKTTLSCAFACQLSRRFQDRKVLLFSTDPAHSLSDCLAQTIGPQETKVNGAANLFALEIDPDALFRDWKQTYSRQMEEVFRELSEGAGLDVRFDLEVIAGLLDLTPPGLDELMCLAELAGLVERRSYDFYVLDTAPAGHTLRFLELFGVVRDWLRAFFEILLKYRSVARLGKAADSLIEMSQRVKRIHHIFTNPQQCQAIPVAVPAKAAWHETGVLLAALERSGIHYQSLLVNQVIAGPAACASCARTAAGQVLQLDLLRKTFRDLDLVLLPRWPGELRGVDALAGLLRFSPVDELPRIQPGLATEEPVQVAL